MKNAKPLATLISSLLFASALSGATWTNATHSGEFSNPGNWDNGVPDISSMFELGRGVTLDISDGGTFTIGTNNGAPVANNTKFSGGTLDITSGQINFSNRVHLYGGGKIIVGDGASENHSAAVFKGTAIVFGAANTAVGDGSVDVRKGGTLDLAASQLQMGNGSSGSSSFIQSGGTAIVKSVLAGNNSTCGPITFKISDGDFTATDGGNFANSTNSRLDFEISGNGSFTSNAMITIGRGQSATANITITDNASFKTTVFTIGNKSRNNSTTSISLLGNASVTLESSSNNAELRLGGTSAANGNAVITALFAGNSSATSNFNPGGNKSATAHLSLRGNNTSVTIKDHARLNLYGISMKETSRLRFSITDETFSASLNLNGDADVGNTVPLDIPLGVLNISSESSLVIDLSEFVSGSSGSGLFEKKLIRNARFATENEIETNPDLRDAENIDYVIDLRSAGANGILSTPSLKWLPNDEGLHDLQLSFQYAILPPSPLIGKLNAEFSLPVYLNQNEAQLVFERVNEEAPLSIELSFAEQNSGYIPVAPSILSLAGNLNQQSHTIDISAWPDGQYKAFIREVGDSAHAPLVRGLVKQSIAAPELPSAPVDMSDTRMLFVDDWLLSQRSGLTRRIAQPEMIPVKPWEASGGEAYAGFYRNSINSFHMDSDGCMNVRISTRMEASGSYVYYWAKSRDMENWEIITSPGEQHPESTLTDLSALSMDAPKMKSGAICRAYDPKVDGSPDISQVRVYFTGTSTTDGEIDWNGYKVRPRRVISVWEKSSDLRLILKNSVTELPTETRGIPATDSIGDWSITNDNFGRPRLSADGRTLQFWQTRRTPRYEPFRIHYDNILSSRLLVTWSSQDGIHWTPTAFNPPSTEDSPYTEHYDMYTWREENEQLDLAFFQVYDAQHQKITAELASSRDGISWQRVAPGTPFLSNGDFGEWNFGFSRVAGNRRRVTFGDYYYEPMQGINALHFMYLVSVYTADRSTISDNVYQNRFGGRMVGEHGIQHSPIWEWYGSWSNIVQATREERLTPGFMRYRKDRWASLSTTSGEGTVVTKPLNAAGQTLAINAATGDNGQITVEVLDANGNPLPAYSGTNAAIFSGDSTGTALRWSGGQLDRLPGTPFILSLHLTNADLYALNFSEETEDNFAPAILSLSQNASVSFGSTHTISVEATGTPPLSYTWLHNNTTIAEAPDSPSHIITKASPADTGNYQVRVSNPFGSITSSPIVITVSIEDKQLLDYALMPTTAADGSLSHLPKVGINPETGLLEISFTPLRPELSYTVQASTDLIDWTDVHTTSQNDIDQLVTIPAPDSPDYQRLFLRLKISTPLDQGLSLK